MTPPTAVLPAGLSVRPMRLSDVAVINAHLGAYCSALIGFSKYSPEGVANYLRDPALELASDTWLVFHGDTVVGSASAVRATTARANIEVTTADAAVAGWLLDRAIERGVQQATEQARRSGADEVTISLGMLSEDQVKPALAKERGMTVATSIQRMQIQHSGPVEVPGIPDGIVIRRGALDEATRRAAHRVIAESFADQPASVPRPYDDWVLSRESRSTFDWSQLTVLELDGRAVAVRECDDNFRDANCGYIGRLGVLPETRGRGLAKFLLRDAFALDAAAGRSGTILHVDTSNPTPAVAVYLAVGMRPVAVSDIWRLVVPV
jgi:mycothiol synthase